MLSQDYCVYILTNQLKTVLYTGVTNNIKARLIEHWRQRGNSTSLTGKYYVHWLIFFDRYSLKYDAIAREKKNKGWSRWKKMQLINSFNPEWKFLNFDLFDQWPPEEVESRF